MFSDFLRVSAFRILLLLIGLALFVNTDIRAQSVANYVVARTTGITYNSIIATGNSFASWRYTGGFSEDDNRSEATNIGFDFWYDGQRYTQFSVSTNGFIDFSSSANDGGPFPIAYGYVNNFFSFPGSGTWLALAPFYDDMTTRAGSDPLGTSIKYELSGTAPNRVLTVEWDGMAVYQNTTPDLNFQVKLYETTGVIEFNYETMNSGTNNFSYTVGINAASISNPPTASQLKTQQTANTNTFSNTPQNNLSTMPTANSQLRFTPPAPTAPTGTLTFSGITNTGMTLNWPNWASNEIGYVLYSSTDNVNFYFNSQTAANATASVISGLLPSTTYYWRIYAVTEGALSAPLSANATTLAPGTVTSVRNGRWDRTNTWDCNCIPTAGDNVFIQNTHTVSLRSNSNMECNNLTVGQGTSGRAEFTNNTQTLTINGNLTINNGATVTQATNSNSTHTVNFRGNIINNGTLNLLVDNNSRCNAAFIKTNGNQTVSGSGVNSFYTIQVDKNTKTNILEITASNFSCDPDALTFTSGGTFKFSSPGTNTFSLFDLNPPAAKDIPSTGRIWMNSANSTMSFGNTINLKGDLQLDNGSVVIGNGGNENLISFGGKLEINGGTMQIAGMYAPDDPESTSNYVQTGGTLTLPTSSSTSITESPFSMEGAGSSFTMSAGTIILQREGGSGAQNLGYNTSGVSTSNVTGGTLQIGNASTPGNQTFLIDSGTSLGNLHVNDASATGQLTANNLNILNDVTLTAGNLIDNGRDITLGGDWLATAGTFTASTVSTVTFNGDDQSITTAGSAFNNLVLAGTGTKSFQDNLIANGNLTFSTAFVPVNIGFSGTVGGNWTNNGSFTRNNETITFNGAANQIVAGTSTTDFTNITVNKPSGSVLVDGIVNLHQALTIQSATTFDADGAAGGGVFTILSTDDDPAVDGRVATLPATASVTGNVTVQRYTAPETSGSTRVYRYISSPVSGQFVSDWQDDFPISGTFSDPNTEFPVGSGITTICGLSIVTASPSLYRYVEPNTGTGGSDLGWSAYPSSGPATASSLEVGRGYAAFIRECTNPTIIDVRGPINQGTISLTSLVSLTNNGNAEDGYNLVGNPYPSAIDWDTDAGWTRTGIGSVIAIRDNGAGGGFIYYDNAGATPLVIATGQAFWVRVTGPHTFAINEQAKTGNGATFYRVGERDQLTISLNKGPVTDKAVVNISPMSVATLDDFDGPKLDNSLFDISTLSEEGISMAVNSLNKISCGTILPIKIKDMTNGTYQLSFERLGAFAEYDIKLFDRFTNTVVDLFQTPVYSFTISGVAASKAANRFELRFQGATEVDRTLAITANAIICDNADAVITLQNSQPGIDYYVTHNGVILGDSVVGTGQNIALIVPVNALEVGSNTLVVIASHVCVGKYEMIQRPEIEVLPSFDPNISSPPPQCGESSVTFSAVKVPEGATVNWFDEANLGTPVFTGEVFTTPMLSGSKTYYTSIVSSEGCEGNRIAVEALIVPTIDAAITISGDTLMSNYSTGNQWYRDNQVIPDATGNTFVAGASGVYSVVVQTSENCIASATISMLITGQDEEIAQDLSVYPNPVKDAIAIQAARSFDSEVSIIDSYGRMLGVAMLEESADRKTGSYDMKNLPAGVYYLLAKKLDNSVFLKIVKH